MTLLHLLIDRQTESEKEYETPLKTNNGRNPLFDAIQEKLDAIMYLRQAIEDYQDGVVFHFTRNFHTEKQPKPINGSTKKVIDLIMHDSLIGLDKQKYNRVPKWLKSAYAAEVTSTLFLLQNIEIEIAKLERPKDE